MILENGLTQKQEIFCQEYAKTFNATQSAIKANYSPDTAFSIGSENLRKPLIKKRIDEIREGLIDNIEDIDEKWIVKKVLDILERAMANDKLSEANKSIELLGKWRAMWTDRQIQETEKVEDFLPNTPNGNDIQEDNESEINENTPEHAKNGGNSATS